MFLLLGGNRKPRKLVISRGSCFHLLFGDGLTVGLRGWSPAACGCRAVDNGIEGHVIFCDDVISLTGNGLAGRESGARVPAFECSCSHQNIGDPKLIRSERGVAAVGDDICKRNGLPCLVVSGGIGG